MTDDIDRWISIPAT